MTLPLAVRLAIISFMLTIANGFQITHSSARTKRDILRSMQDTCVSVRMTAFTDWNGEVVSNTPDGRIRGCSLQQVEGSLTDWIVTIDGEEADLGRFSEAIYKKIIADAKRQRFQGFRPGTIPPHLEPTYKAFAMDECARETVLEAMQQNKLRPFENARNQMSFSNFVIPPASMKKGKKAKEPPPAEKETAGEKFEWRTFSTMKEAITAGWVPGMSFSFQASDVKGQKIKD